MAQIFVSYNRADGQFVKRFIPLIRRVYRSDNVWFDGEIHGGADWWQMILNQIERCNLFVYLVSNESLGSPYCQAELREALRLNKQILPVIVDGLKPPYPGDIDPDLGAILCRTQYVDMSGGFDDADTIAKLYGAVKNLLDAAPQSLTAPETSTPTPEPPVLDKPPLDEPRATLRAAWIGFFAVIIAAIIGLVGVTLASRNGDNRGTNPETPTNTPDATATLEAFRLQSNTDWTPAERKFDGVTMVLVPVGHFMMGSDDGDSDEQPRHEVHFDEPFWIGKYEVTNAEYGSTGCENRSSEPTQPRNCVDWFEARDFCEDRGARLPTEAEWEYAARGPDEWVYPWGDKYEASRVIDEDDEVYGDKSTAPVGSRPSGASWVGALDMSGNVWEWTSSLDEAYPYVETDGRERDTEDSPDVLRVLRGGSFDRTRYFLHSANRRRNNPDNVFNIFGFRCARSSS